MTLNEQAKIFWAENEPSKRMHYVPGLHVLAYGANYDELEPSEKQKVRDMLKESRE